MSRIAETNDIDPETNTAFLKDLTRYYMDFLETDFHKRPLPKRHIRLRDAKGHLTGINLRKYESFRNSIWQLFTEESKLSSTIEIKRRKYKSRIKTSIKSFIDQNVEELKQTTLDEIIDDVFKDFESLKSEYSDDWDSFYEESIEAIKRHVLQNVIQPLLDVLEKPLTDEKSLGLETIFELEDDLISSICSDFKGTIDRPIIDFFTKGEVEALTICLSDFLSKDIVIGKLKNYFAKFSSSDLFLEFNEVFENKKLNERWSYFVGQVGGVFKVESRFNNYAAIA